MTVQNDNDVHLPMADLFANLMLLVLVHAIATTLQHVELPKWADGQKASTELQTHMLLLPADGKMMWDRTETTPHLLPVLLSQAAARGESVGIRMDSTLPFKAFWSAYRAYVQAGFKSPPSLQVETLSMPHVAAMATNAEGAPPCP